MTEQERKEKELELLELEIALGEAGAKAKDAPTQESRFGSEGYSATENTLRGIDPTRKVRAALGSATFGWAPEFMGWLDAPSNATPEQAYESSQKWRKEYREAAKENPAFAAAGLMAQPDPFGKIKAAKGALGPALQAATASLAGPGEGSMAGAGISALAGGAFGRAGDALGGTFGKWLGGKSAENEKKALAEVVAAAEKKIASARGELGQASQAGSRGIENLLRYASNEDLVGAGAADAARRRIGEPATQEAAAQFALSAAEDFPAKLPAMKAKREALAELVQSKEDDIERAISEKMDNPIVRELKPRLYRDFSRFAPTAVGAYLGSKGAEAIGQDRLAGAGAGGFLGGILGGRPGTAWANMAKRPDVRAQAFDVMRQGAESLGGVVSEAGSRLGAPIGGALSEYFGLDAPVQESSQESAQSDFVSATRKKPQP
jgi:hypothetical protein